MTGPARHALRRLLTLIGLIAAGLPAAHAHQASDAYLHAAQDADGRVTMQAEVALRDLDVPLELDADADGRLTWGELRARQADITRYVAERLPLDAGRCGWAAQGFALDRKADGAYVQLRLASDCRAASAPTLGYELFRDIDPTHRGLLLVQDPQGRAVGPLRALVPGRAPVALSFAPGNGTPTGPALGFVGEGFHHILVGADHVLFLICLLLPLVLGRDAALGGWRQRLWPLLGLVTAFTVGHSITLGLASWRVLAVPPRIIEPLIAATIALTAVDNLWPFLGRRRVFAAFGFGLIHGFGFAGPLIELNLAPWAMARALLQFNLGVEAGQLLVVVVAMTALWPLRERRSAPAWLRGASIALGALALLWFSERLLDFKILPI